VLGTIKDEPSVAKWPSLTVPACNAPQVVIVEILVAERDPEHPLTNQGHDFMLDTFLTPLVMKARRKPIHHSDRSIGRSQQQRSGVGGHQPGIECRFHTATFHASKIK
jgi:hypothetical protein